MKYNKLLTMLMVTLVIPMAWLVTISPEVDGAGSGTQTDPYSGTVTKSYNSIVSAPNITYFYVGTIINYTFSLKNVEIYPTNGGVTASGKTISGTFTKVGTYVVSEGEDYEIDFRVIARPTYTVSFNSAGGNNVSPITCNPGASITLPSCSKSGYNLTGWYTAATGGTRVGSSGDSYTPTGNVTLYARWQAAVVEITSSQGNKDMIVGDNFSYTVTTLPADATISISGCSWMSVAGKRISGNPSGAGDWTVTVTAAKPGHTSDTQTFTIHVVPRLSFTSAPSTGVIVNLGS